MDAATNILAAVNIRLKGFSGLTDITDRIFSGVPQQTQFPYVNASIMSQPFAANDFSGQQHTLRIQAHSQSGSMKEALDIREQVFAALDRQEEQLTISGVALVKCEYSGFADCFIEDDGRTWQSIIEFTLLTM